LRCSRPAAVRSAARSFCTAYRPLARAALIAILGASLALGGCKALRHHEDTNVSPELLYARAAKALHDGSYQVAIKDYEALTARYPFSDAARQSRIDLIYAYYRQHEKESAIDAADTFIRENPTHPRIDYAYYIKGLVYFERDRNFLDRWFGVDLSARPPQDLRKSFDALSRVVTQYPQSEYAADARERMVYLRNRLADYEIHVARYYVRRGAWVAAVDRARYVLETYDGAPATRDALEIMVESYQKLGMADLAADSGRVLAANFPATAARASSKHWWKFW
jgi:outer membrane protein assembly factor BamD